MSIKEILTNSTGGGLRGVLSLPDENFFKDVTEIRVRIEKPLIVTKQNGEFFISKNGATNKLVDNVYKPAASDISATLEIISGYSLYAFEDELRNGYITIPGGHRVGIVGRAAVSGGKVKTLKNISGLNIRITRQVLGCGKAAADFINSPLKNTMIISPPARGKTTLLRDIIRILSDGGATVGLVDERSEVAGCYLGVAQNDVGLRTDVLDGCPKAEGMLMLLRGMSPDVIAVDELGGAADSAAVEDIINAGVKLICTSHGGSIEDIINKPALTDLMRKKFFERFIVLKHSGRVGVIEGIYDEDFKKHWGE